MIDTGKGPPVVLIPGIPGRWEWMRPAIDALAERHRVLSFSLTEAEMTPGVIYSSYASGYAFEAWVGFIDRMLERAGEPQATFLGVSFGGLIAARYASRRPARASALVLASAPSPHWRVDPRTAVYMRYPRLAMSVLVARSFLRLGPEVIAAKSTWPARLRFGAEYAGRALRWPPAPRRMAAWVEDWMATDIAVDCSLITAPTLLITGEPGLERVVPISNTLDYQTLIPHARHVVLAGTGHVGVVTKPREFARLVTDFANAPRERARIVRHHAS